MSKTQKTEARSTGAIGEPIRIAIYSHDTYGLGHLRRNLVLARALRVAESARQPMEILLVTGSPRAYFFEAPDNVEIVKVPSVTKNSAGAYVPRNLEIPLADVLSMRKGMIREAVFNFRPHLFLVDHAPVGLCGELLPLLGDLRHRTSCQLILGLRDILDDPERVVMDWERNGVVRVLDQIYHHIWVYGDRNVFCLEDLYQLPESVGERLVYLGYLGRDREVFGDTVQSTSREFSDPSRPHILGLIGGGGDGEQLAMSFFAMLQENPERWNGTLVTGPFLAREHLHELETMAGRMAHARVLRFTSHIEPLLAGSDMIVTMGGYNSMVEAHSLRKRVIVVPRVYPRREQWLRASVFEDLGLLRMIEPEQLDARSLASTVSGAFAAPVPPTPAERGIEWNGAHTFARRIQGLSAAKMGDNRHGRQRIRA